MTTVNHVLCTLCVCHTRVTCVSCVCRVRASHVSVLGSRLTTTITLLLCLISTCLPTRRSTITMIAFLLKRNSNKETTFSSFCHLKAREISFFTTRLTLDFHRHTFYPVVKLFSFNLCHFDCKKKSLIFFIKLSIINCFSLFPCKHMQFPKDFHLLCFLLLPKTDCK